MSCVFTACIFWKISGGRNGDVAPPPSDKTRRCRVGVSPDSSLGAGGRRGQRVATGSWVQGCAVQTSACSSPIPSPARVWAGHRRGPDKRLDSAVTSDFFPVKDFTLSRHCSANLSILSTSNGTISASFGDRDSWGRGGVQSHVVKCKESQKTNTPQSKQCSIQNVKKFSVNY